MSQNIGVAPIVPGGQSALNVTAAGVIKSSPGLLRNIVLVQAGTTGGSVTLHDSNALVTAQTITGVTLATNGVITISTGGSSNPFAVGNTVAFASVGGTTGLNTSVGYVVAIGGSSGAWTITTSINTSSMSAWTSGGTIASYSAQTEIISIAEANTTYNIAGNVINLQAPCLNGILVSAVFTGTPQINVFYN